MTTTSAPVSSSVSYGPHIARIFLGLAFAFFGLNGFLNFIPPPKQALPPFIVAMMSTGYFLQLMAGTQLLSGVLLLVNRFVPLALALLAPILVNILAYHLFLAPAPADFAPGIVLTLVELYLVWSYRHAFLPMLAPRVVPR